MESPVSNTSDDDFATSIHLIRSQESFDKLNQYEVPPEASNFSPNHNCKILLNFLAALVGRVASQIAPSSCSGCLFTTFPFFNWIQKYNLKRDLLDDFVSGCTVGVMHIPQGDTFVY